MKHPSEPLDGLLAASRECIECYERAAETVDSRNARVLFRSMAKVKRELLDALSEGRPETDPIPAQAGTLAGFLHQSYVRLKSDVCTDPQMSYISDLEEHEERLLGAFGNAYEAARTDPSKRQVAEALRTHLPRVRACHDEIRRLGGGGP